MIDESFKFILHHSDGEKEVVIGNLRDLNVFLNDRIDLEICKLENLIEKKSKSTMLLAVFYSLLGFTSALITVILGIIIGF